MNTDLLCGCWPIFLSRRAFKKSRRVLIRIVANVSFAVGSETLVWCDGDPPERLFNSGIYDRIGSDIQFR